MQTIRTPYRNWPGSPAEAAVWLAWNWNMAILAYVFAMLVLPQYVAWAEPYIWAAALGTGAAFGLFWRLILAAGALTALLAVFAYGM